MKLDKRSSIPLYAQLKEYLAEQIETGVYAPGARIPTELALCAQLELSRPTVRQAIAELVAEGSLHIIKGKGTFVTDAPSQITVQPFAAWRFDLFRDPDPSIHRRYVEYRKVAQPHLAWTAPTQGEAGGKRSGFTRVEWVEEVEQSFAYCVGYYPESLYPDLLKDLRAHATVSSLRAQNRNQLPVQAESSLQVRPAQGEESRYLDISKAAPVFLHDALFYNDKQQICAQVQTVLRTDAAVLLLPRSALPGMQPSLVES